MPKQMRPGRHSAVRARALAISLIGLLSGQLCLAQSNSLRKRGGPAPGATPTNQPTRGPRELVLPATGMPLQRAATPATEAPPPNPALLASSLIAVEIPKPRKLKVHDLITIIVREDKKSLSDARLKSEKTWTIDAQLRDWFRFHDSKLIPQNFPAGNPGIGFDLDNQYEGKGKTDRKDSLTTRVTAEIIDVKPNGTLVLEATKSIALDEDIQIITLTGICRSEDVTPQNTILSTQLAGANISVRHTGPARDASRRGWLMRGFDLLRPF